MKRKARKAFSLIELSIVILIIGIIVAGITQSSRMISAYKLLIARNQTNNSPVASISNIVVWLDATSEASFNDNEAQDGSKVSIWKDLSLSSITKNNAQQSNALLRPTYKSRCINSLPCLNFDSANSQNLDINLSDIVNSNYTVFFVERRQSGQNNSYFLASENNTNCQDSLNLGYDHTDSFTMSIGGVCFYPTSTYSPEVSPAFTTPVTRIHSNIFNVRSEYGRYHYVNGQLARLFFDNADPEPFFTLTSYNSVHIGGSSAVGYFYGDIAEVIIFNVALKAEDRKSIERYLVTKWGVVVAQ